MYTWYTKPVPLYIKHDSKQNSASKTRLLTFSKPRAFSPLPMLGCHVITVKHGYSEHAYNELTLTAE